MHTYLPSGKTENSLRETTGSFSRLLQQDFDQRSENPSIAQGTPNAASEQCTGSNVDLEVRSRT